MEHNAYIRRAAGAVGLGSALAFSTLVWAAAPASAQMPTLTFVGETGGDDVSLLLGSASFSADGVGLKPVFGLTSYLLTVDGGDTDVTVEPWVGLRQRWNTGFLQGKVGYAWKSADDDDEGTTGIPVFGGGESGVVVGGHLEYWGDGSMGLQGIGSYNTASSFLWSRARATFGVAPWSGGTLALGGDLVWQGHLDDDTEVGGVEILVPTYEALQVGPVLQWQSDRLIGGLGGGWKKIRNADDTWYFKVELTLIPG